MDQRSWSTPQLNEAAHSVNESSCERNCERIEISGGGPSFRTALFQQKPKQAQKTPLPDNAVKVCESVDAKPTGDSFLRKELVEAPNAPVSLVESPALFTQLTPAGPSRTIEGKRDAAMLEYEDDSLTTGYTTSPPLRKKMRSFPRRNSVVIHRRAGGTASTVQDLLTTQTATTRPHHSAAECSHQDHDLVDTNTGPLGLPTNRSKTFLSQLCPSQQPGHSHDELEQGRER